MAKVINFDIKVGSPVEDKEFQPKQTMVDEGELQLHILFLAWALSLALPVKQL